MGIPFNIVFDRIFDIIRVIKIPRSITAVKSIAENIDLNGPIKELAKNIVIIAIRVGNLPLHGTKLFVIMAISLSRGESIILHPMIPAALHPNPMHIESACFPHAHDFLKYLSKCSTL